MRQKRHRVTATFACAGVLLGGLALGTFHVRAADSGPGAVFVIALENHNWEQPVNKFNGAPQQIYQNPAAPYMNSLVSGTSTISEQVSYATAYYHVEATPTGAKFSI